MIVKLIDLVNVHTGYSFRGKISHDKKGDTFVVQMKDLTNEYRSIDNCQLLIDGSGIGEKHLLRRGDILFISKGANNYAIVYNKDYPKAIATSIFFVMRPKSNEIVPAYLTWYINQRPAQQYLETGLEGTYIRNINKKTISELPIELPALEVQHTIAELYQLEIQEGQLLKEIKEKRERLLNAQLLNSIKNEDHGDKKTERPRLGEFQKS